MRISTTKGLQTLLKRMEAANHPEKEEWANTIKGCIEEGLAMDELDYENTPKELRPLWRGLK